MRCLRRTGYIKSSGAGHLSGICRTTWIMPPGSGHGTMDGMQGGFGGGFGGSGPLLQGPPGAGSYGKGPAGVPTGGPSRSTGSSTGALGGPTNQQLDDELVYVPCEIGDLSVEMMVDTGAQSSVISTTLVKRLNLAEKINRMYQGVAAGVGRARILGKLQNVPVTLGCVEFCLDFVVLEAEDNMLMLGIDQMRRFKCVVDYE